MSVHGANRLGGNSLAGLLVFGARAGRNAAEVDSGEAAPEPGPDETAEEADLEWPTTPGESGRNGPASPMAASERADGVESTVEAERARIETLRSGAGDRSETEARALVRETTAE